MKKSKGLPIILICILLIAFTLFEGISPKKYDILAGEAAPVDIYATREVVDEVTTEKQRDKAQEAVESQFVLDNDITLRADRDLANLFLEIEASRQGRSSSFTSDYCLELTSDEYKSFREMLTDIQQEIMNRGVKNKDEAIADAKESIRGRVHDEAAAAAGAEILSKTIAANKEESPEKTQEEIKRARAAVENVVYKENQIIVRKGDIVNEAQFAVLSSLGLVKGKETLKILQLLGVILFMLAICAATVFYLKAAAEKESLPPNYAVIISAVTAVSVLMTHINKGQIVNVYMIPTMAGGILISILISTRISVFMHTLICAVSAIVMGQNAFCFASVLLTGYIAIFLFANISQRTKLVVASCWCTALAGAVFLALALLQGLAAKETFKICGYGAINGALSSLIVMGFLPFLETFFDIITPFRLMELSNPDNPLLSRLLKEAPGTYHHSLMVGNLAEAACEAIGGNSLLARVGAYYHDVGKLKRAEMFTENQYGVNPHDNLTPIESAGIIISHVKDGNTLLCEYKLPGAIRDIEATHHGSTPVAYFLYQARLTDESVLEKDFRYPGPLPKTKESTVVMLSDSVEAAVRSLDDKSEGSIRAMVKKIINGKMEDGQLSSCPLTFAEIEKITDAFLKVFGGYFHSRIRYPEKKDEGNDN